MLLIVMHYIDIDIDKKKSGVRKTMDLLTDADSGTSIKTYRNGQKGLFRCASISSSDDDTHSMID